MTLAIADAEAILRSRLGESPYCMAPADLTRASRKTCDHSLASLSSSETSIAYCFCSRFPPLWAIPTT